MSYAARGRVLLDTYIDNARLEQLQKINLEENLFSKLISEIFPLDACSIQRIESNIESESSKSSIFPNTLEHALEQSDQFESYNLVTPIKTKSKLAHPDSDQNLKIFAEILAKLLVNPKDTELRLNLQTMADNKTTLLGEIATLTIFLLDTWVNTQHSPQRPANALASKGEFTESPENAVISRLMEENKQLKRKVAFYKSQVSKFYGASIPTDH